MILLSLLCLSDTPSSQSNPSSTSGTVLRKGLCFAQRQVSLNIILSLFKLHKFPLFSDHLQLQVQSDELSAILEAGYYSTVELKDWKGKKQVSLSTLEE